jgi:hypothetical protein
MKKLVLIAAGLGIGFAAFAQKSQVRSAKNYLGEKNYEKAKAAIEQAINDESTKGSADAWATRGLVYLALQQQPENEAKDLYNEAGKSFKKAIELQPDYEKEDMNNKLFAVAIYNFNAGLAAFEKQGYDQAFQNFANVVDIATLEGGKRFTGKNWLKFDTVAHQSSLYQGYSAYYTSKYDDAIPLLEKGKTDPIVKNANIYLMLADAYEAKADNAKLASTLAEARKEYPNDKTLVNRELNYYIKTGKSDELVGKLEEAIRLDPTNADLLFTLGIAYDGMANPKDKTGKDLPKPANFAEVFTKAEQAYSNALKASDKADIHYNMGALYFNRAVVVNESMNAITGSSAADIKKYDALKAQRDEWFTKALPYLEKTVSMYEPQAATLKGEDKTTYMSAIIAAKEIYAKQNKLDKSAELKKKLEAVNK